MFTQITKRKVLFRLQSREKDEMKRTSAGIHSSSGCDSPEMLMSVVSILPPLVGTKLSMKVGPPLRLILDRLTFTNSRLMLRESFLPVTEDGSSSTVPSRVRRKKKKREKPTATLRVKDSQTLICSSRKVTF